MLLLRRLPSFEGSKRFSKDLMKKFKIPTTGYQSLPPGQDHKRIFDGNKGPNTGGMGVYAPLSFVTPDDVRRIENAIIQPTLDGLIAEGTCC